MVRKEKDPFAAERINEDVVGTVEAKGDYSSEPGVSWGLKRFYCARCRDGYHNSREDNEVCRGPPCKCRCQYCYVGKDGRVRPYKKMVNGVLIDNPDDSDERLAADNKYVFSKESDAEFEKIMAAVRKPKDEPRVDVKDG